MSIERLENGHWFDTSAAEKYDEATHWDGNNNISNATGSQWDHEMLYHSAKGAWIMHRWSQWQGRGESYAVISAKDAYAWLIAQEHDDAVPPETFAAAEV